MKQLGIVFASAYVIAELIDLLASLRALVSYGEVGWRNINQVIVRKLRSSPMFRSLVADGPDSS
jgi:hypothetical protein